VYDEYKDKHESIKGDIEAYVTAQTDLYKKKMDNSDDTVVVKNAKKEADKKWEKIAKKDGKDKESVNKATRELIDKYVKDK